MAQTFKLVAQFVQRFDHHLGNDDKSFICRMRELSFGVYLELQAFQSSLVLA